MNSIATWHPVADELRATAGEYFTYQIGVKAYEPLTDVRVVFKNLRASGGETIDKDVMTCFNNGGVGSDLVLKNGKPAFNDSEVAVSWTGANKSKELIISYKAVLEFDRWVNYDVCIKSCKGLDIKDISLVMPVSSNNSVYTMGLGLEGGLHPEGDYHWKWDVTKHQDMLWIGNVDGGIRLMLKDENYKKPLVNIYYEFGRIVEPVSWSNAGNGGIDICSAGAGAVVKAFSGERHMAKGDELHFDFELLLTPFKLVNRDVKYGDRYFHGGTQDESGKLEEAAL